MQKQPEVAAKLFQIHYQRNKNLWIFHFALILLSTYFQRADLASTNLWWMALVVMGVGLICRNLLFYVFYKSWRAGKKSARFLNYLSLLFVSLGWSLHFLAIAQVYGLNSYYSSHSILLIAAIMMGGTVSSAAKRKSFHTISFPLWLCIFSYYLYSDASPDNTVIVYLLFLYGFCTYYINLGNKELKRSIHTELEAEREKNRIIRIIDTVPAFVCVYDKDFVCIVANKICRDFYPNIVGSKIGGLETKSNWEEHIVKFAESGKSHSVDEASSNVRGKFRWTIRNCRRTSENGVVFVSTDITELVAARNKLREQEGKAHYTAKLASLGEMAAGIAHEINNPLTIIQGSASIVQKLIEVEPADKESIRILLEKLIQTTNRISKIILSLKALSRSGEHDPFEDVDLSKLLDQCIDICQSRCDRAGIRLKTPQFSGPVLFKGREVQLSQVILNLLSNAIDAVKNLPDPWIEISYQKSDKKLEIFVTDSGPGVPQEIRKKIMEPFFTTKDVNQGTGLGLSISKTIADSHQGELVLLDGTKSTFKLCLPLT